MKAKILALLFIFLLISCKKEVRQTENEAQKISDRVSYRENNQVLSLNSGKFSWEIQKSSLPFKKIVLLNASLTGFLTELGLEDRIAGISSPEYIYSEKILGMIKDGRIADVGSEQKYIIEKIIAIKPDAVIANYVANFANTYELLKNNGIDVIFLDEYLETDPLNKSKYLLLFGKLFGEEKRAEDRYTTIKATYDSVKSLASKTSVKPVVLANEMYGNQWFMPGGKTQFAVLMKDAGANYILKENQDDKAIPMSYEEVLAKSREATFWVNAGIHGTRKSLLAVNPNYERMNVFSNGKIYDQSGRQKGRSNDFFESGSVRSDLILKDYVSVFHPELLPGYELTYMRELQ